MCVHLYMCIYYIYTDTRNNTITVAVSYLERIMRQHNRKNSRYLLIKSLTLKYLPREKKIAMQSTRISDMELSIVKRRYSTITDLAKESRE